MKKILCTFLCTLLLFSCKSTDTETIAPELADGDILLTEANALDTDTLPESTEEAAEPSQVPDDVPELSQVSDITQIPDEVPEPLQIPLDIPIAVEQEVKVEVLENSELGILTDEMTKTETTPDTPLNILTVIDNTAIIEALPESSSVTDITQIPDEVPEPLQIPLDIPIAVEQEVKLETLENSEFGILTDEMTQTEAAPDTPPSMLIVIDNTATIEDLPESSQLPDIIQIPEVLQLALEPVIELIPEVTESIFETEPIVPEQTVEINEGQYFDILFPGQGWIYLGEVSTTDPVVASFSKRQTEDTKTLFVLYAKNIGSTILHFYKPDALENTYLDEYIEVVVVSENERIADPISVLAGGLEEVSMSSEPEVSLVELIDNEFPTDENTQVDILEVSMDEIFERAQLAYDEQRYTDSLKALDTYFAESVDQLDKAWFLSGQIYEENSDVRNMRKALYAYETLVTFFPTSSLWDEAQKRITYINRFYFNIR